MHITLERIVPIYQMEDEFYAITYIRDSAAGNSTQLYAELGKVLEKVGMGDDAPAPTMSTPEELFVRLQKEMSQMWLLPSGTTLGVSRRSGKGGTAGYGIMWISP